MADDDIDHARAVWDAHARADPLWAVLSSPDKTGRRWQLQEFMKTGEREIALLFRQLAQLQQPIPDGPVLDFGCGVGRLTQALARRRDRVIGADISPAMIAIATRLNRYPDRARYISTAASGLAPLPGRDFALIYSNIVLQHVPPELSVGYISDFFGLLGRGGVLVFQLPSHRELPQDVEVRPMAAEAYQGTVSLAGAVPDVVPCGAAFALPIAVRNTSGHAWRQPDVGPLAAGNHWLDGAGRLMLHQDDGRAPLPQVLEPGDACRLLLTMRAPAEEGAYVCEIDLVHEAVTWFEHRGSPTLRVAVNVRRVDGADASAAPLAITEYPVPDYPGDAIPPKPEDARDPEPFAMHAVPHQDVIALIARHGGTLLHLEDDRRAGPEWVGYRYFIKGPD